MPHRPFGPSNADIAAWSSKKLSVRRSTRRLAVCSVPMAKLARWVDGVRVEVIEWRSLRGRKSRQAIIRYLCNINYPVIAWRNNPASPLRAAQPIAGNPRLKSVSWRPPRRHFIQICRILAPQYLEKFHIGNLNNLRFCPVVLLTELLEHLCS